VKRRDFIKSIALTVASANSIFANTMYKKKEEYINEFFSYQKNDNKKTTQSILAPRESVILKGDRYNLLKRVYFRLKRLQRTIGYGHFNIVNYEDALLLAKRYPTIGPFRKDEIDFMEELFYENATKYGFFGEKVLEKITDKIPSTDTKKIPYTGHYLYRGRSEIVYAKIKKDLGNRIILTSGVRGIVKQMYLFLNKAVKENGNLSQASRSLAPPGYSFHGVGDFDVGKVGFGYRNFTSAFSHTAEYKMLMDLGYIRIRYPQGNPYGVRFEPWHIKVV